MLLYNRVTGEKFEADPLQSRLARMRRRIKAWGDYAKVDNCFMVMVTLTLRTAEDYSENMIRPFMRKVRDYYGRNLQAYAWGTEMQKRGVPHYHVLLCFEKPVPMQKFDKNGWWSYGMTRWEIARSRWYLMKYTGKEYQKENLPSGARMYRVWISSSIGKNASQFLMYRLSSWPRWVEQHVITLLGTGASDIRLSRPKGGGVDINGDTYYSPWVCFVCDVDWQTVRHLEQSGHSTVA